MSDYDNIPNAVESFAKSLNAGLRNKDTESIAILYEEEFAELTDRFYKQEEWPDADSIAPFVGHDDNFMCLYKELYFRDIYSRLQPSLDNRRDSFSNYMDLFNIILGLSDDEPEVELPVQWMWDIIDEFIYQFGSFHNFRTHVKSLSNAEVALLKTLQHNWSVQTVVKYLMALVDKAGMDINKSAADQDADRLAAVHPFFEVLGHFALVGLARINVMIGDYTSALDVLAPIDLWSKRDMLSRVPACFTSLYHSLSFSYMMMHRYLDAYKTCCSYLNHINRNKRNMPRNYQYKMVMRTIDHMHGIVALCVSFHPQRVEDNIHSHMMEKYGDYVERMRSGDTKAYEELFSTCCPKFVTITPPFFDAEQNSHTDTYQLQQAMFMREVTQRRSSKEIFGFLKLCSSLTVDKLASFLDKSVEDTLMLLLLLKYKGTGKRWRGGKPVDGELMTSGDVDFQLAGNNVQVSSYRGPRRYGEFFIRNILKLEDQILQLRERVAASSAPQLSGDERGSEDE